AAPLPGFTCWNSSTEKMSPSTSMVRPVLKSFTEITGFPPQGLLTNHYKIFGGMCQQFRPVFRDQDVVLDADAAETGDVDARFHGDDHARHEKDVPAHRESRLLVDVQPDAVAGAMAEAVAVAVPF